jgi:hypothetical protein
MDVGLLLSVLTGYFAYQGVCLPGSRTMCAILAHVLKTTITVLTNGQWLVVGVAVLVVLFPWSSRKEMMKYMDDKSGECGPFLFGLVFYFSAVYVVVAWVFVTIGFWMAIDPQDCDQVMYKPLWEYQPYYVVLISILNIPVYLVVGVAALVLVGYLIKLYITKAWCSVKVTKLEHSAVPPEYASTKV